MTSKSNNIDKIYTGRIRCFGEWPKNANISLTLQERKYTDLRPGKPAPFGCIVSGEWHQVKSVV